MPMEDFEFKRDGNTLTAYDKATGELVDSGEYSETANHKQKRRFVDFKQYAYKKFELEDGLWVGADFLKRNLMSTVRYFNAPVLGCRTYFNKQDVDQWLSENFLPYRRTIALCLRNPTDEKQFTKELRKEWEEYVFHKHANGRMHTFQPVQNPDRTAIYPPVQIQDDQHRFRMDHEGEIKPLPKGNMSEITMTRRTYLINGNTIEWKFGKGLRPKTLFEIEKLPDDAVWRLFSRKVRGVISPMLFTTSYDVYLKNGGQRR